MKILGIDYGVKRIGIAVSDESQTFARELTVLSQKDFQSKLPELIKDYEVESVVFGLPLNMQGNDSAKTKEVREFAAKVELLIKIPVKFQDERFSSQMAQNLPGGNRNIDSLAAQILLQNYLDSLNANR